MGLPLSACADGCLTEPGLSGEVHCCPTSPSHLLPEAPRMNDHAHSNTGEHKPALPPEPPISRTKSIASSPAPDAELAACEP